MKSISAFYLFYYIGLAAYSPYLSIYFNEKGISPTEIGQILAIAAIIGFVSQPVMGIVNDRLSSNRTILLISTVISPFLVMGYYFFEGYAAFLIISALLPILQSGTGAIGDSIAVEIGKKEGFSFGSVRLWGALGFSVGAFITGFMYGKIGFDKSFFLYAAISLLVLFTLLRLPQTGRKPNRLSVRGQVKLVLFNKPYLLFVVVSFLLTMAATINFNFLPLYFKESGYDKSWIGTAFAIAAIIEVPMFWISAKLNRRIGRFMILCLAGISFAGKCLVLACSPPLYVVLAMQLLDGIYFAFFAGAAIEIVSDFATPETNATYQTVFAAVTTGLGSIIGNPLGGVIMDQLGAASLFFTLFLFCAVSSIGYALFHFASKRASLPEKQKESLYSS